MLKVKQQMEAEQASEQESTRLTEEANKAKSDAAENAKKTILLQKLSEDKAAAEKKEQELASKASAEKKAMEDKIRAEEATKAKA
jgi:hypothetical protein